MALVKEKKLSINYYKLLPEGAPYQLIEGELIMTPAPNPRHQIISANLFKKLFHFIDGLRLGIVLYSPIDVYLDDENALQPDMIFISNEKKEIIKNDGIYGAPDMVIEILSPATAHYDLRGKFRVYERSGVKEYWIVDPEIKSIEVYVGENGRFSLTGKAEAEGRIESSVLKGLRLAVNDVL